MTTPARTVIDLCGGVDAVAEMIDRDTSQVRRWTYSKTKGGTGGLIPTQCAQRLLVVARKRGIDLRPEHFFDPVPDAPDGDRVAG